VFDGTAQSLDHALTSQPLDPWVRGAQHTRGNADAPFDFDSDATTSLRTSDHDGTVLFLTSDLDADSVPDNLDRCSETQIPEGLPALRLAVNHYALVDGDTTFDTTSSSGKKTQPVFTLRDTYGCSCGQILDRTGEVAIGQRNLGCSEGTIKDWIAAP
jgi:hypothetical protein